MCDSYLVISSGILPDYREKKTDKNVTTEVENETQFDFKNVFYVYRNMYAVEFFE